MLKVSLGQNYIWLNMVISLLTLSSLSYCLLSSPITNADNTDIIDDVAITVPTSCTLVGTDMDSHTATLPNGIYSGNYNQDGHNYTNGIGTTTLKAYCNDKNGFAIYAAGYTGEVIGGTNSNKLIHSSDSTKVIETGTATGPVGNVDVSNWAMKLTATSGNYTPIIAGSSLDTERQSGDPDFSTFTSVPNSYTKVAYRLASTDIGSTAEGATLSTTYAAYISKTQAAGNYSGKVIYTLVHPSTEIPLEPKATEAGCIRYYPNGGSVVGTMGCQSVTASVTSATLLASNFSRQGYGFAGWSDVYDYATNENAHFYGPQEYIEFAAGTYTGSNPGLSLYAVWIKSEGNLQDSTKATQVCTGLTQAPTDGTANLDSVSALTDQRDNETYAIAKLADGNCWMIENLRLEAGNTTKSGDEALAQGYGHSTTYGNFTGLATTENANFTTTNPPTANSLYSTDGSTTNRIQGGNSNYYYARMPRYNNYNHQANASDRPSNPTEDNAVNTTTNAGMYSYGNYYTWSAAMANIKQYTSATSADDEDKTSETVNTSLCPAGWRLPRGGNKSREATNDLWTLIVTGLNNGANPANYSSSATPYYTSSSEAGPVIKKIRAYPNNFLFSGYFNASSANYRGSNGNYWSSTAYNSISSNSLNLSSINLRPGNGDGNKYLGYSIRCLLSSG